MLDKHVKACYNIDVNNVSFTIVCVMIAYRALSRRIS